MITLEEKPPTRTPEEFNRFIAKSDFLDRITEKIEFEISRRNPQRAAHLEQRKRNLTRRGWIQLA